MGSPKKSKKAAQKKKVSVSRQSPKPGLKKGRTRFSKSEHPIDDSDRGQ